MVRDILAGMILGAIVFLAALVFGASVWIALLLYSLAGTIGLIAISLIRLATYMRKTSSGKSANKPTPDTAAAPSPTRRSSDSADPKTR